MKGRAAPATSQILAPDPHVISFPGVLAGPAVLHLAHVRRLTFEVRVVSVQPLVIIYVIVIDIATSLSPHAHIILVPQASLDASVPT